MTAAAQRIIPSSHFEQLREARDTLRQAADSLVEVSRRLDTSFCSAVEIVLATSGSVIVTGMGKAGLIGQKIAATLSSTGTRSHFLHPAEAIHGDLGSVHRTDVALVLSNSGETEELIRLLPSLKRVGLRLIAITSSDRSTLGASADVVIALGRLREADAYGLAPTTSTTAMLGVGDALALVVSRVRGFTPQDFAALHPGGSLGRRLTYVTQAMRPLDQVRTAHASCRVREAFISRLRPGRRSGAVLLIDDDGRLEGLFTDSDLARLLERRLDAALDGPIRDVMTRNPVTVTCQATLADIVDILSERKISELPVIDDDERPLGLIDITDVIGWSPPAAG